MEVTGFSSMKILSAIVLGTPFSTHRCKRYSERVGRTRRFPEVGGMISRLSKDRQHPLDTRLKPPPTTHIPRVLIV